MEVGNSSNINSNHQMKKRKVVAGEAKEDRISRLPDYILHRILSSDSITMKDAVQTCVLSKRWRYVWTTVPTLVFDYGQFLCSASAAGGKSDRLRVFTHFVNRVLSLRDPTSNVFNLSLLCPFLVDVDRILVKKCICYAVCHNAQQLHIKVGTSRGLSGTASPFVFPHCLINCDSLKVLKLVYFEGMPMDKSLHLPGLKTLQLNRFSDGSANFIKETVGNCPNLEDLRLDDFQSNHFDITAPQLRNLDLCFQRRELFWISSESEIVVSTPKLTSFKLEGNVSPVFSDTTSLPSLDIVQVDICPRIILSKQRRIPLNVIKMFGKLGQAKSVTLSWNTLQILAKNTPATFKTLASPFHNLEHLNLIAPREGRCSSLTLPPKVITYLIQGSSCVDTLVVNFPKV